MSQTSPFESVVDEAERAATAGDYATAERLLREALIIQEARLGPDHPDLANTLNNLGVVCEHTNNFADAERSYRRAFTIATTSLAPDHPYVLTSQQNLTDFCVARGMPVDLAVPKRAPDGAARPAELEFLSERNRPAKTSPSAPAAVPARTEPAPEAAKVAPPPAKRAAAVPAAPVARTPLAPTAAAPSAIEPAPAAGSSRRVVAWVLIVLAIVVVALVATRLGGTTTDSTPPSPSAAAPPAAPSIAAPSATAPADSNALPPSAPPRAVSSGLPPSAAEKPKAAAVPPAASGAAASAAGLEIVDARLCRALSTASGEWSCTPPGDPVSPGPLSFYMRLKSKSNTVVQVRWYQGSTLRQSGALQVLANPGAGYRTFSRRTIEPGGKGEWRVELQTKDGRVLHEARFVVR